MTRKLQYLLVFPVIALALLAAGCGRTVTTTADSVACVYGDQKHGQRLKEQIQPGSNPIKVGRDDQVVFLPASNRFYMASEDDNIRDPRAPRSYVGYAKGSVPVEVQGQIRFRFNLAKACEWFAKHGRRNADSDGDLGFNQRGGNQADTGWARYLAENFGVTMQQAVQERLGTYSWPALVYNYPTNADEAGNLPEGETAGELQRLVLGDDLGETFSKDLEENLGGQFFCGVAVDSSDPCPPMEFQVINVATQDQGLMTARAQVEKNRQELANTEAQLTIGEKQLASAEQQQRILAAQLKTEQLQAQVALLQAETKNADCIVKAKYGLDCQGNRPAGGVTVHQGG